MKPHPHAEVIKAWADGKTVEFRQQGIDGWHTLDMKAPAWDATEYRVKPEAPEKEYPRTKMTGRELINEAAHADPMLVISTPIQLRVLLWIANAALRHAIDAEQVVVPENAVTLLGVGTIFGDKKALEHVHKYMGEPRYPEHLDVTEGDIQFRVGGSKKDIAALMAFCAANTKSEHEARDMAIAKAVCREASAMSQFSTDDLAAIIAGVKP